MDEGLQGKQIGNPKILMFLVGNKCDMYDKQVVSLKDCEDFIQKEKDEGDLHKLTNIKIFECSAKEGTGI